MKKFAFISRHKPTQTQIDLAALQNIELVFVGDLDAFHTSNETIRSIANSDDFHGAICVHPAIALRLTYWFPSIGVFENANRAPVGAPVQFEAKELHVYHAVSMNSDAFYCKEGENPLET